MPDLYPTFEAPEVVEQKQPGIKYGKSWCFDFQKGDFALDGGGKIRLLDGHRAWVQWCIKTVLTQRYSCLIYGKEYGIETDEVSRQPTRAVTESEVARTITEALLVDPRTEAVRDFEFKWNGDELYVSFTVVPTIGSQERLEVTLSG